MRVRHVLLIVGLALMGQGAGQTASIPRNLSIDPSHFDRYTDGMARHIRDGRLADDAWAEASNIGGPYSKHYARGFREGFIDFLNDGGHVSLGDVPLVPPRSYWRVFYQSPEGNLAIRDWYDGWRHGVAMARQSGYRDLTVLPTTVPVLDDGGKDGVSREPRRPEPPAPLPQPKEEPTVPPVVEPEMPTRPPVADPPKPSDTPTRPPVIDPPKPTDVPPRPPVSDPPRPPVGTPPRPPVTDPPKPSDVPPRPPVSDPPKPPTEDELRTLIGPEPR